MPISAASRTIHISNLKIKVFIGVLAHERVQEQLVLVNARIDLGEQSLLPNQDIIEEVLDYREIRQTIIDILKDGHAQLLETRTGQVVSRLLQFRGVKGVSLTLIKPDILPDCEVAIEVNAGSLSAINK